MTIEEALTHPWLTKDIERRDQDLLFKVRKGFVALKMFKKAVHAINAITKLSGDKLSGSSSSSS